MRGPSRKQLLKYYFLFSYIYFITNYCYVSLPPTCILRHSNLTPHISRMIDLFLGLIFNSASYVPLAVRGLLLVYLISLLALGLFVIFDLSIRKLFSFWAASKDWPTIAAAVLATLISLYLFGPYYTTSN